MSQTSHKPVVRSGIPWWLWGMIIAVTAVVVVGTVVTLLPEDPQAIYSTAMQSFDAGDQDSFQDSLAKLKGYSSHTDHATLLEGLLAAREGKDLRALELFESIKSNEELKPVVLQKIGRSCANTSQYKEAIEAYDESIALDPENADETRILVAQLYYGVGALEHAKTLVTEVIDSGDKPVNAIRLRARIGTELFEFDKAVTDYARLLETPGERAAADPELIAEYVRAILVTGDEEKIKEASLELGPDISTQELQWELDIAAGHVDEVMNTIQSMKGSPTQSLPTDRLEALGSLLSGDHASAITSIEAAMKMFPRDLQTFELAEEVFEAAGKTERQQIARQNIEQLRELRNEYLSAVRNIGDDFESADLRFEVARIALELGMYAEARRYFAIASVVEPERRDEGMAAIDALRQLTSAPPMLVPFETSEAKTEPKPEENSEPAKTDKEKPEGDESEAVKEEAADQKPVEPKPEEKASSDSPN